MGHRVFHRVYYVLVMSEGRIIGLVCIVNHGYYLYCNVFGYIMQYITVLYIIQAGADITFSSASSSPSFILLSPLVHSQFILMQQKWKSSHRKFLEMNTRGDSRINAGERGG